MIRSKTVGEQNELRTRVRIYYETCEAIREILADGLSPVGNFGSRREAEHLAILDYIGMEREKWSDEILEQGFGSENRGKDMLDIFEDWEALYAACWLWWERSS